MANTNEKRTGPSEVEQGKNANEIFDQTDDIPEVRKENTITKTQDDLDRGEELYTGFGFGSLSESSKFTNKDSYKKLSTDENLAENRTNQQTPTTERKPVEADETTHKPAETKTTPIDQAHSHDHTHGASRENLENEVYKSDYDSTDERIVEWDKPTRVATVRSTITSTDASSKEPSSKEKIVDAMTLDTDTRLVIEPQRGEIAYQEEDLEGYTTSRANYYTHLGQRETVGNHIEFGELESYDKKQTPDYELADVYYTKANYETHLYDPRKYEVRTTNTNALAIKNHYKAQQKQKKKNQFPWGKVAVGVAATLGAIGLVAHLTDDDDHFWE